MSSLPAVDYEKDIASALENSYSIWSADDSVRKASDDYENDVTNNLHAYEAAKIQRDATEESVKSSFRKLYKTMQEKVTAMTAAQGDLTQAPEDLRGLRAAIQARHDFAAEIRRGAGHVHDRARRRRKTRVPTC